MIPTFSLPVAHGINQPQMLLSEVFGPTIQGEGPDMGKACFFVRTHGCPVKCPGCDTHYTWDGSEHGTKVYLPELEALLGEAVKTAPGAGVVITGGEPLAQMQNKDFARMLSYLRNVGVPWMGLETSGFMGRESKVGSLGLVPFLQYFDTVAISPKITPCLHGQWEDDALLINVPYVHATAIEMGCKVIYKFVARDQADFDAVDKAVRHLNLTPEQVMIMPYGIHREEIIEACERLLPYLARTGYTLTPRLHAIIWGAKRGV